MSELPRHQFSIQRILCAFLWLGIGFAIWRAASPFDWHHFVDDDPDNIYPRMLMAFYLVPAAGAIGSLRGCQIRWVLKSLLIWLIVSVAIIALGMGRVIYKCWHWLVCVGLWDNDARRVLCNPFRVEYRADEKPRVRRSTR